LNNLAGAYRLQGKFAAAESLYADVVAARLRVSDRTPETLMAMSNLALVKQDLGKFPEALDARKSSPRAAPARTRPEHPETLTTANNLALLHGLTGDFPGAEAMFARFGTQKHVLGQITR